MELFILQYVSCAATFIGAIGSIGAIIVALSKGFLRNKTICETFVLDYYSFAGNLHTDSEIKKIRQAIEHLTKAIEGGQAV